MDQTTESGWREVFGVGVVETGAERFAVVGIDARVDADLRVRLRFRAARHEPDDVWLTGTAVFDTVGFTAMTTDEVPVTVRPLESADAQWLTHYQLPDLSREQLETIARAYAATEAVDDGGVWDEREEPVETMTLDIPGEGLGTGVLIYLVTPPYGDGDLDGDDTVWLARQRGAWVEAAELTEGDTADPVEHAVHREMAETVIEVVDAGRIVTPAAAALASRTALSTVVGQDPEEGVIRRRMRPDLDAEVRRLLEESRSLGVPPDDPDVEYATWLLSGYDGPDRMAWTSEVFGVITRLATAVANDDWVPGPGSEVSWHRWWDEVGLERPTLPRTATTELFTARKYGVWSTTRRLGPMSVYMFHVGGFAEFLSDTRRPVEDFLMTGVAGHGVNSWGLGVAAKVGSYAVMIQTGFGGVYMNEDSDREAAALTRAWNRFLERVESEGEAPRRPDEPVTVLILYSGFRGYAQVLERDVEGESSDDAPGWRVVLEATQGESEWELRFSPGAPGLLESRAPADDLLLALVAERARRWEARHA